MENKTYENMFLLTGKTALVSGGTGGLGSAIARALLQRGAQVAVCGGHPEKAAFLEEEARQTGRQFLALRCDIRNREEVAKMLDEVEGTLGPVDILVNSAGMNHLQPAEDYEEEKFDQVMS
ncbi:MAG: SDR family NAD(P)-dependent oxidoreductase, partial [Lacrimispora sp.]